MRRGDVAVVILARDASRSIGAALGSVVAWAAEVVVVDDGSVDATAQIAREAGARVLVRRSHGNYGEQRNFALTEVTAEWVLMLDADEVVPEELTAEMFAALRQWPDVQGYEIGVLNHLLGVPLWHAENSPKIKLFRRCAGRFTGGVHESFIVAPPLRVARLRARVLHYPYPTIHDLIDKQNRYTDLEVAHGRPRRRFGDAWGLVGAPAKRFIACYMLRQGFRDGPAGLIWAVFSALYEFVIAVKIIESERMLRE